MSSENPGSAPVSIAFVLFNAFSNVLVSMLYVQEISFNKPHPMGWGLLKAPLHLVVTLTELSSSGI